MLLGHQDKQKIFRKLVQDGKLSHGYLFFGENHVGKFLFAKALANFLENRQFKETAAILTEALVLSPEAGSIGIDAVRDAKEFLSRTPIRSSRRTLIIDSAGALTHHAQSAILKVAEEPPSSSLIILIANSPETILSTLRSRLQKIYFPRVDRKAIENMLVDRYELPRQQAVSLAEESLGQPGLAVMALQDKVDQNAGALLKKLFGSVPKRDVIESALEDPTLTDRFLAKVIAHLAKEPIKNYKILGKITDRLMKMSDFNTNKRLQLESALWNI